MIKSNSDKIRAMSDEELADTLFDKYVMVTLSNGEVKILLYTEIV